MAHAAAAALSLAWIACSRRLAESAVRRPVTAAAAAAAAAADDDDTAADGTNTARALDDSIAGRFSSDIDAVALAVRHKRPVTSYTVMHPQSRAQVRVCMIARHSCVHSCDSHANPDSVPIRVHVDSS